MIGGGRDGADGGDSGRGGEGVVIGGDRRDGWLPMAGVVSEVGGQKTGVKSKCSLADLSNKDQGLG